MLGAVGGQPLEVGDPVVEPGEGRIVGIEVALVAGDQEAALPGLGVADEREQVVEAGENLVRVRDLGGVAVERRAC